MYGNMNPPAICHIRLVGTVCANQGEKITLGAESIDVPLFSFNPLVLPIIFSIIALAIPFNINRNKYLSCILYCHQESPFHLEC